jgi:DNA adenine methylase
MTTVLRYPGGKSRAVKHILPLLPESEVYISPFFGGGAVELALAAAGKHIIANDKFEPLYNFWSELKNDPEQVKTCVDELLPFTKEKFRDARIRVVDTHIEAPRRAAYYFCINRTSFSGATLSGGYSEESCKKRCTPNAIAKLTQCDLSNIVFHNLDFTDFIQQFRNEGVMYIDPPYLLPTKNNTLYGNNGDLHEAFPHDTLADILKNLTCPWVLSYNDCEYVRKTYSAFNIREAAWSYGMNKTKKSSELIITNR